MTKLEIALICFSVFETIISAVLWDRYETMRRAAELKIEEYEQALRNLEAFVPLNAG